MSEGERPGADPRLAAWLATACLILLMCCCGGGGSSGSSNSTPASVNVPNTVGLTQASATTAITSAGLVVGTVTMQSSSTVASGNVISETPVAGTSVTSGSAVNLVISSGPATYPVSATVSGLTTGASVTVLDNGKDSLTFQSNSTQQFAIQLALNATYSVTVGVQPAIENCVVTGGTGQVTGPVSVSVSCSLAPPSTSYPAFTAPYPLVQSGQTPAVIIVNPRIIPVFFSNSPDQSATLAFLETLIASQEWSVLSQYGVGSATVGTPVYLTSAAPASTDTAGISSYVSASAASWGTLDGSEIFVLYYPPSTTITDDVIGISYHNFAYASSTQQQVPYAVVPNYSLATHAYLQYHEIAEASTDPIPGEGYFYLSHDASNWSFGSTTGTELADMCERFSEFYDSSLSQLMQGIWSDSAVNNSQYPCTIAGSSNLGFGFGAYPVLPDTYLASSAPGDTNASVGIAPGASVTVPINIFSYGPLTAPISIAVVQTNTISAKTNALTFSLDQSSGLNGSVVHLTITAPSTPLSTTTNYASFSVMATAPSGNNNYPQSTFPGLVTNPGASCSSWPFGSSTSGESVIYSFPGGSSGATPLAGLVEGTDGNFYGTTNRGGSSNDGTVFQVTPGGTLTTLHSFSGSDGAGLLAGLVQGSDGSFYGATDGGGANNEGAVFKITPAGTFTTLYSFSGGAAQSGPDASLVQGSDGNFYGTTNGGGSNNGTVFKITPNGTLTTLYAFSGPDGSGPAGGLAEGNDGNFYGTTYGGGSSNYGTVFKITPTGTFTTLYSFVGGANGSDPRAGLVQGTDGNFYGTTRYGAGGSSSSGTVFKITPSGTLTTLYSFSGSDGSTPWADLIEGSDGNFYGTTIYGGAGNAGTVFKITPTGTLTTIYSFSGASDGSGPSAPLLQGNDGNLYGTTAGGGRCGPGALFKIVLGN